MADLMAELDAIPDEELEGCAIPLIGTAILFVVAIIITVVW